MLIPQSRICEKIIEIEGMPLCFDPSFDFLLYRTFDTLRIGMMQREGESSFTHRFSTEGQVPLSLEDIEAAAMPCYIKCEEKTTCISASSFFQQFAKCSDSLNNFVTQYLWSLLWRYGIWIYIPSDSVQSYLSQALHWRVDDFKGRQLSDLSSYVLLSAKFRIALRREYGSQRETQSLFNQTFVQCLEVDSEKIPPYVDLTMK